MAIAITLKTLATTHNDCNQSKAACAINCCAIAIDKIPSGTLWQNPIVTISTLASVIVYTVVDISQRIILMVYIAIFKVTSPNYCKVICLNFPNFLK